MPTQSKEYYIRLNLVISAWICIALGSAIIISSGGSPFSFALASPLSLGGIIMLLLGLNMPSEKSVDANIISSWIPDASLLPDAGRPMYRIDTTLKEPIRTSVLCGRCSNITWIDGTKPNSYVCSSCNIVLWVSEEE
ncbi:MAG: hypothetical protein NLN64_04795 [Candidatus Thalassarchaeaceae archaeon]|nr:hypothetical protein [Candidatus Thalassarchaeaceae archaeon]